MVRHLITFIIVSALSMTLGCGKVSDLSNQAGLISPAYLPVTFAGKPLLDATVGIPYKEIIQLQNGQAPFKFSLTQGALPDAVAMDPNAGILSGVLPVSVLGKSFTFTISVIDANLVTATQAFTIKAVADANYKPVAIADQTLAKISIGAPFKDTILISNGAAPFTFKVSNGQLPVGLSLKADTGVISGTVQAGAGLATQFSLAVSVTDGYGNSDTKTFSLSLAPYAVTLVPKTLPPITPTIPYTLQFDALNATPPVKYNVSGSLPEHLSLSLSGVLATTPPHLALSTASSSWPVDITAVDANGVSTTTSLTINIAAAPAGAATLKIQNTALASMSAGTTYSGGVNTTGGVAPLKYTIASGNLPTGLTLDQVTGLVSGTLPFNSAGVSYAAVIQVADSAGASTTQIFSGTVGAGTSTLTIVSNTVSTPIAGAQYSSVIAVSGGQTPYAFTISSGTLPSGLTIGASTGSIGGSVANTAAGSNFLFAVTVTDAAGQTTSKTYSGTVGSVSAPLSIATTSLPSPLAGSAYAAGISVTGGTPPFAYSVMSGSLPTGLALSTTTGLLSGTLGYGTAGNAYAVNIKVQDAASQSATQTYTGTVGNGASTLTINTNSVATPTAGSAYAAVVSVSGGVTPYTFTVSAGSLPTGLTIGAATGVITGTPAYSTASTAFGFTVTVTDSSGQTAIKAYSGSVGAISPALAIQSTTIATPTAGSAYSTGIAVTAGVAPLTYAIQSGALPTGLSLSTSTGIISGTVPYSAAGNAYVTTLSVTDSVGQTAVKTYSGTVANGATTLAIGATALGSPMAGSAYSTIIPVTGGVTPYTFSLTAGSLPSGLSLNTATGVISGTSTYATASTAYSFTATCTDSSSQTASKAYSGSVGAISPALTIQTSALITPSAGATYASGIAVSGGVPPLSYAVQSGALPSGLTLSTSTGVISGTVPYSASGATYVANIQVSDSASQTATANYSGTVASSASTLAIGSGALAIPLAGAAYAAVVPASGGVAPYTFSISSGALPTGLTLASSTGVTSGTPAWSTAGTTYTYGVTVSDQSTQTATKNYSGTVGSSVATFSISNSTLPTFTAGSAYLGTIGVSGGYGSGTFSISTGSLPSGISLGATTGQLSGTVALTSRTLPYNFTIAATDGAAHAATQNYSGTVSDYVLTLVPSTLTNATPGAFYTAAITTVGGTGPYTYSKTSGNLPTGLSLNTANGVISGVVAGSSSGTTANFSLRSIDSNGASVTQAYSLTVSTFAITLTTASLSSATEGTAYNNGSVALAAAGGTSPYTYSYTGNLPSGVGLASGGVFFGTPATGTGSGTGSIYPINLTVTDAASVVSNAYPLNLTVGVSTPTITTSSFVGAVLGQPYTATLNATGGRGPYTYAMGYSGGTLTTLPSGLTLNSGGTISGTPIALNVCPGSSFKAVVTDSLSQTSAATTECINAVNGIALTMPTIPTVVIGSNYKAVPTVAGGTAPITFTSTGLPTGLTISNSTGTITGFTNASVGDYSAFITATDSTTPVALTSTGSFTFHVRNPLSVTVGGSGGTLAPAGTGVVYAAQAATVSGGLAPYTYTQATGSLPPGLVLNSSGTVTGTPSSSAAAITAAGAPNYNFTVMVTDSTGNTATSGPITLVATTVPVITNTSLPIAVQNVPYVAELQRVGGSNQFAAGANASRLNWQLTGISPTNATLSSNLSLNSASGRLTGTPAVTGTFNLSVSVSDANGFAGTKTLPLVINAAAKTLDLRSAHFSEPCLTTNTNCDPRGFAVAKLTGTSQQFVVYPRNDSVTKGLQIAKIDSTGRIPVASASNVSVNVPLIAGLGTISSIQIDDIDQDGKLDIVFSETTNHQICILWNVGNTVDSYGMPTSFSIANMNCYGIPPGANAANQPIYLQITPQLRSDAVNSGKRDILVADFTINSGNGASVAMLLNVCPQNGACSTASQRSSIFQGYLGFVGSTTNASPTVTVANTAGIQNGAQVFGLGIPVGTTVLSFVANTSVTLSANATATTANAPLSILTGYLGFSNAVTSNGSPTITTASTAGVTAGMPISGIGIPNGATVSSFVANTSITMSANATASGTVTANLPNVVVTNATGTIATSLLTTVGSTVGIMPGMSISGTNIPLGTSVVSTTANTITLSQNVTATGAINPVTSGGSNLYTPIGAMTTPTNISGAIRDIWGLGIGYFNAVAPAVANQTGNATGTYASGATTCPSIMIAGMPAGNTGQGTLFNLKQTWTGTQCAGDFQSHSALTSSNPDEAIALTGTPWLDTLAIGDFNGDGISDLAVGGGAANAPSNSVRVYLMQAGASTFNSATGLTLQVQTSLGGTVGIGVSKIIPYCINGASTCSGFPALLVTCDRDYNVGRTGIGSCVSIFPNQCGGSVGCTSAFEQASPSNRIDYPGPYGLSREPIALPLVSTGNFSGTGNTVNGSGTITGMASTTGIVVGQTITGSSSVPANAYVTAVINSSSIVISPAASATTSGVALTVPLVPTLNDIFMMGSDNAGTAMPYALTYARNSSSTTDPLKSGMMLNLMPTTYGELAEAGTMKIVDMNGDSTMDLAVNLVNQSGVSAFISNSTQTPSLLVGSALAPNYLSNYLSNSYLGCPTGSTTCMPDASFYTTGASHGYPPSNSPNNTALNLHMQNTMDVGDLNNDGVPDVVVVGYYSRGISVSLGSKTGSTYNGLANPATYPMVQVGNPGDFRPNALVITDVDQDGIPDIVVAGDNLTGTQIGALVWYKGNGDGTFQTSQAIPPAAFGSTCQDIRAVAAVDLDGDGRPEIAVLCYSTATMTQGVFVSRRNYNGGWNSSGNLNSTIGGVNGTIMKWGHLTSTSSWDLIVAGLDTTKSVTIIPAISMSTSSNSVSYSSISQGSGNYFSLPGYPSDIDIADLNADGYGDLVIGMQTQNGNTANFSGHNFYTCLMASGATTCKPVGWGMEGYQTSSVVAGDVNGDGLPDIFVGYRAGTAAGAGYSSMIYRTVSRNLNISQ